MRDPLDLKNTRGYRSKYINSLNDAVKQTRIIGGDVEPVETEAGTFLFTQGEARQVRFQLFAGVAQVDGEAYNVRAVSDGCFFVAGQFTKLRNAVGTYYAPGGLMPRSSGWYSGPAPVSNWRRCEVIIISYGGEYFLGFRYDGMELYRLLDGGTADMEADIEVLITIGVFSSATGRVEQFVNSDIYYGGGTAAPPSTALQPWEIIQRDGRWFVVNPQWTLDAPYTDYPEGATRPAPEYARTFAEGQTVEPDEWDGEECWPLEYAQWQAVEGFTAVYAVLDELGIPRLFCPSPEAVITETPTCIKLGTFTRENGEIVSFTQIRKGSLHSVWRETQPFFIENGCSGEITRYSAAPQGLAEGTMMDKRSFWVLETFRGEALIKTAEQLNYDMTAPRYAYPQTALLFGTWVWRYNLHFRGADQSIIKDDVTTAVLYSTTSHFASVVDQPYVERVQVVYPDTPLDQGSVDAVSGRIKVLAVELQSSVSTANLFKTEVVSATEGGIIEVTQE